MKTTLQFLSCFGLLFCTATCFPKIEDTSRQSKFQTVTIFLTSRVPEKGLKDSFFINITSRIPSITVNMADIKISNDNRTLVLPIFKNPRQSTIYVIHVDYSNQLEEKIISMIDELVRISPVPTRPKSLLIISDENSNFSVKNLTRVLNYAWFLKFLDFTIMKTDKFNKVICMNFNPFTLIYDVKHSCASCEIFPDKLRDVKNYPIIIPVFDNKPYVMIEKKDNNYKVQGTDIEYIEKILEKMNFNKNYVLIEYENYRELSQNLSLKLSSGEINLIPITHNTNSYFDGKNFPIGSMVRMDNLVVVVPIREISQLFFSFEIFSNFLSFPLILLMFAGIVKLFKFDSKKWNGFYIFRVLVGIPSSQPQKIIEKQIFLLLAVLSILYSNIFFSKFEKLKVLYKEENYDSIKRILASKMKIYSSHSGHVNDPEIIKRFFSYSQKVNKSEDCLNNLIKTRYAVCILSDVKANYNIKKNLDHNLMPIMKMSKIKFRYQFVAFSYEKASPYAEKFNEIIQRIIESDLLKYQKRVSGIEVHDFSKPTSIKTKDILMWELLIIFLIGDFLASIVFLTELSHFFKKFS